MRPPCSSVMVRRWPAPALCPADGPGARCGPARTGQRCVPGLPGNAQSRVAHGQGTGRGDTAIARPPAHLARSPLVGELHRIAQQVQHHLPHAVFVDMPIVRRVGHPLQTQSDLGRPQRAAQALDVGLQAGVQVHPLRTISTWPPSALVKSSRWLMCLSSMLEDSCATCSS